MGDRVGQQLGNYRLVTLLGQGGYAEVYLGQHVRLNLQAAIKVLHAHLTDKEAEHFQQAAALAPEVADTHIDLGTYYANHGRFDEAIVEYNRAIDLEPHNPTIYMHLSRMQEKMNREQQR